MKEISKEKRISKELKRLTELFSEVDGNQRSIALPLLQNAAFMAVTLQDLQETILESGTTDIYTNGENQTGVKQSAELQAYNSLIKNYTAVIKSLSKLLPPEKRPAVTYSYVKPEPPEPSDLEKEHEKEIQEMSRQNTHYVCMWSDELEKRKALEEELNKLKKEINYD